MSNKTKEDLLAAYKKANKPARLVIIGKAGCESEAEYFAYLDTFTGASHLFKKNQTAKPTIHNVFILDASSSMGGGKIQNAMAGINSEIDELKTDNTVNYTQTIADFSGTGTCKTRIYKQPIAECNKYYCSPYGMTALNESVGIVLTRLLGEQNADDKVLVKIFTDGEENNSTGQFSDPKNLSELIKECEAKGFTVTFVGTDRDVRKVVDQLKISSSNVLTHDNTARGMQMAFMSATSATKTYASKVLRKEKVTENFYSKQLGKLD